MSARLSVLGECCSNSSDAASAPAFHLAYGILRFKASIIDQAVNLAGDQLFFQIAQFAGNLFASGSLQRVANEQDLIPAQLQAAVESIHHPTDQRIGIASFCSRYCMLGEVELSHGGDPAMALFRQRVCR